MTDSFGLQHLQVTRGATSARVTVGQEYMLRMIADDPDPASMGQPYLVALEGPLDVELLRTSFDAFKKRHSCFRTRYEEVSGELHQFLLPDASVAAFELAVSDRSPLPEAGWGTELAAMTDELRAMPFDLDTGVTLRALLRKVAPDRHLLVAFVHHIAFDAGSPMLDEILQIYHDLATQGRSGLLAAEPVQYIDFAHALERWPETPAGKQQYDYWERQLRDAPPVAMPLDLPRDEWDRRAEAVPYGIVAARQHHPVFQVELPPAVRETVRRAAHEEDATPYVVYLAALATMLHQKTGQADDLCIENTATPRYDRRDFNAIQGLLSNWTIMRIPVGGAPTSRELIRRTYDVVMSARQNGVIHDYYRRVPRHLRRMVYNYVPSRGTPPAERGNVKVRYPGSPWPIWKRPWELHLTMFDTPSSSFVVWTGNESLYRRETLEELLHRYIDVLATL